MKHQDITEPFAIHPFAFVGATDPSLDADNEVAASKAWLDTTGGAGNWVLKVRNAANDGWETVRAAETVIIQVALSDMTTVLTTGTGKAYVRAPRALTLLDVRASLFTASSSGVVTFDINKNGSTILSTKLTIDASEETSETAATPPVISDDTIADDDEISFDIDGAGTDAAGAIVTLIGVA